MIIKEEQALKIGFTFEDVFREINIYPNGIRGGYFEFAIEPKDDIIKGYRTHYYAAQKI